MKLTRSETELTISGLGEFTAGLFNQITICSDPAVCPKAADRLYSTPSDDPELNQDWKEYVQPDLKHLFETANETVNGDLAAIEQTRKTPEFTLRIPLAHVESWLCSLNQARLALAAHFDFTQHELEDDLPIALASERDLARFQIDLYGEVQDALIRCLHTDE